MLFSEKKEKDIRPVTNTSLLTQKKKKEVVVSEGGEKFERSLAAEKNCEKTCRVAGQPFEKRREDLGLVGEGRRTSC